MKIALLHFSTWPEMGGVENVVRDQANMLVNAGHEVKVLSGAGLDTGEPYEFVLVPELAPDFELNKNRCRRAQARAVGPEFQPVPLAAGREIVRGDGWRGARHRPQYFHGARQSRLHHRAA